MQNSTLGVNWSLGSQTIDQTNKRHVCNTQSIPTTAAGTSLTLGAVTVPGWAMFKNMDATNYIEIGDTSAGTFVPVVKLLPGEVAGPMRIATTAPKARANTAAVDLNYEILDS